MEWVYLAVVVIFIALAGAGIAVSRQRKLGGGRPQPKGYVPPRSRPPAGTSAPSPVSSLPPPASTVRQPDKTVPDEVEEKMKKLSNKVFGRERANNLVAQIRRKHPDKSLLWCVEKAIWDVERGKS